MNLLEEAEHLIRRHHPPEDTAMTEQPDQPAPAQSIVQEAEEHLRAIVASGQRLIDEILPRVASGAADAAGLAGRVEAYEANPAVRLIIGAALSPARQQQLATAIEGTVRVLTDIEHEAQEHEAPAAPPEPEPEPEPVPVVAGGQP